MVKIFLFQAIQFSQTIQIQTIQFSVKIVFVHTQLNVKTVRFQTVQFCISTQFSSNWHIDKTLRGATTSGQSEPESNGNERVLRIPQSSSITGLFSVLSWTLIVGILPLCRGTVGIYSCPSRLGKVSV